ncbi:hypothetical protein YWIDRAFT_07929 [Streptomyces sp. SceaMP-e96]|nr:hypothetical protein YWIDRAFT_07929 [Streptomyces sp. SceaMP-e96]
MADPALAALRRTVDDLAASTHAIGYLLLDTADHHRIDTVGIQLPHSDTLVSWPVEEFLSLLANARCRTLPAAVMGEGPRRGGSGDPSWSSSSSGPSNLLQCTRWPSPTTAPRCGRLLRRLHRAGAGGPPPRTRPQRHRPRVTPARDHRRWSGIPLVRAAQAGSDTAAARIRAGSDEEGARGFLEAVGVRSNAMVVVSAGKGGAQAAHGPPPRKPGLAWIRWTAARSTVNRSGYFERSRPCRSRKAGGGPGKLISPPVGSSPRRARQGRRGRQPFHDWRR